MRRGHTHLKRRLFNLAAAVSLVIAAMAMVGAVRSQFVGEQLYYRDLVQPADRSTVLVDYGMSSAAGVVSIAQNKLVLTTRITPGTRVEPLGWVYYRYP